MPKKAILLIPLTYNDGSQIPDSLLEEIYEAIFILSGGHTSAGTVRGAYRMRDGSTQTEFLEQVWVAYEDADMQPLRELVARFCAQLHQEAMYLEFTDSNIEFVSPEEE